MLSLGSNPERSVPTASWPRCGQGSIYALRKQRAFKERAFALYKEGYSTREVGRMVGKSYAWVWLAVKELSAEEKAEDSTTESAP